MHRDDPRDVLSVASCLHAHADLGALFWGDASVRDPHGREPAAQRQLLAAQESPQWTGSQERLSKRDLVYHGKTSQEVAGRRREHGRPGRRAPPAVGNGRDLIENVLEHTDTTAIERLEIHR